MDKINVDELASFCKRKGFVYQSGEIYGGLAGFWDFGGIGVEFKNNIKREWWKYHVQQRGDMVGMDGSIITSPKTWEASGHVGAFSDVYVKCKKCKKPNKIDKSEVGKVKCKCGGDYDNMGEFNLMFNTQIGPAGTDSVKGYLRPETAQLIFTNFKNIMENARMKLPFGIAQTGKAFRNEISPREFLFRCREFEQMEIEYFIEPHSECPLEYFNEVKEMSVRVVSAEMQKKKGEGEVMKIGDAVKKGIIKNKWHAYWLVNELNFFLNLGCNKENFRIRQHEKTELAHYSSDCWDLEYNFPFGWRELEGIADRSDYDLRQHEKVSGADLKVFDEATKKKYLPYVVCEPSLGVERAFLVFMFDAYEFDKKRDNVVLKLNPRLSPVKAAVFPIVKKDEFIAIAEGIVKELREEFNVTYDASGSVGRRYSRNDEAGTPFCITVDGESVTKKTVTVRERDSTKQVLIKISELKDAIRRCVNEGESILKLGKLVETRVKEN